MCANDTLGICGEGGRGEIEGANAGLKLLESGEALVRLWGGEVEREDLGEDIEPPR